MVKQPKRARDYFDKRGLDYSFLNEYTLDVLVNLVQDEILKVRAESEAFALRDVKWKDYRPGKCAFITVDGTYFKGREAISFNSNGFIGFAGWADDYHLKPIIDGFLKWCDRIGPALQK